MEGKKRSKIKSKRKGLRVGIKVKLISAFLLPVICIIGLGIVSYRTAADGMIANYEDALLETMTASAKYFNLGFNTVKTTAKQIAVEKGIRDPEEYSAYSNLYKSVIAKTAADDLIGNIHIFAQDGAVLSTSLGVVKDSNYIEKIKADDSLGEKDELWRGNENQLDRLMEIDKTALAVSYLMKIKEGTGFSGVSDKLLGYIKIDISMHMVESMLEDLNFGEGSIVGLITEDGCEITTLDLQEPVFTNQEFYQAVLANQNTSDSMYCEYGGSEYLFVYSRVEESGAIICAMVPKVMILNQASDIKTLTVFFVFIASVIAVVTGALIASKISGAIKKIMRAFSKVSKGDLSISVTSQRRDELGMLAESLNGMIQNMRKVMEKVTKVSAYVQDCSRIVLMASDELLQEAQEITVSMQEIDGGVKTQIENTSGCLMEMSKLSEKVGSVYQNTGEIERIAYETRAIAEEGIGIVGELNHKAENTTNITNEVIVNIERLEEESKSISNFVQTIHEIAGQTNLLSLNASIEAARAGEAGKGFAVVASEIRKLAEQTVQAAKQIEHIIESVNEKTRETVETAGTAKKIVVSQEEALHSTVDVFGKINCRVEELALALSNISAEVSEIEQTKVTVLDAMNSISSATEQSAAVSKEINITADKQMDIVKQNSLSIGELEEAVKQLNEAIAIFSL